MGLLLTCIGTGCILHSEHPALVTWVMGIVPGVIEATAGSASGSLSESADEAGPNPRAEVEEVLRMALAWLRRADPYGFPAAEGNSEQGAAGRPPAGHKVGYLLSGKPGMCCSISSNTGPRPSSALVSHRLCQCFSCLRLGRAVCIGQAMSRWTTVLAHI